MFKVEHRTKRCITVRVKDDAGKMYGNVVGGPTLSQMEIALFYFICWHRTRRAVRPILAHFNFFIILSRNYQKMMSTRNQTNVPHCILTE